MIFINYKYMLKTLQYNSETNSIEESNIDDLDFHKIKWINCTNPTKEELEKISEKIAIPKEELERCLDENERPSITDLDNYFMIIFKSPLIQNKEVKAAAFSVLISENLIVTFSNHELDSLKQVELQSDEVKKSSLKKGTTYMAFKLIDNIVDEYFSILDSIEKDINKVEDLAFHSSEKSTVQKIFSLKKTLIFFQKALSANREVLVSIEKESSDNLDEKYIKNFRYLYNDTIELIDMVATYRDILTGTLDLYLSNVSNNLNKIIKKMTAFGSLILVPTFITGLYGMNFKIMPEINWQHGYLFAWGLIVCSMIMLFIFFKKKDWF